jgi:hypothetical protein
MLNAGICNINCTNCHESQQVENDFKNPNKINYQIKPIKNLKNENPKYEEVKFIDIIHGNKIKYPWLEVKFYKYKKDPKINNYIIICHLKNKNKPKSQNQKSILFCHNNNTTLGDIYPFLCDLCTQLRCDVISFDYSGYGLSNGITNIENCFIDTYSVFHFSKKYLDLSNNNFVIFAFGLGGIPALKLCSVYNLDNQNIKGLILYSPILEKYYLDMCNIVNINCPLLAMHGRIDNVSNYEKTFSLAKFFSKRIEWYPKSCRYDELHIKKRFKFYKNINIFFKCIDSDISSIDNFDICLEKNKNIQRVSFKDNNNIDNSQQSNNNSKVVVVSEVNTSTSTNEIQSNPEIINQKIINKKTFDRRTVISRGYFDSEVRESNLNNDNID